MFFLKEVQDILEEKVREVVPLGPSTAKIVTESKIYFIKYIASGETPAFFKEARGLEVMGETGAIDVIRVMGVTSRFILLEYLGANSFEEKPFFQDFGTRLANMHRHTGEKWGFMEDNFLGAALQLNLNPKDLTWPEFFWQNRLYHRCHLGVECGMVDARLEKRIMGLRPVVEELLQTEESPSLLHGDLWSGNFLTNVRGEVCLIDPAVYYGHREAELAMCRLFGGFSQDFYGAYQKAFPLEQGWERRLPLYQLYHVLNHLNLFGKSYLEQVESIINMYCDANFD